MTMSSVMIIKKLLRGSSRAACVSREGQVMKRKVKPRTHSPDRKEVTVWKRDDEAFGFIIRTYEGDATDSEMLTCVCSVKENSPAERAGLKTGDVIMSVNSICVEGFEHQQIVDLIQKGSCPIKMEIVRGTLMKQKELQRKLEQLQWQLREKTAELQTLILSRDFCGLAILSLSDENHGL
ncbi:hypothetical protein HF521_000097 [Silurus meridionalis]|uniref:PDZ domain-containing protein n=1 Tax=Silurus meridionalis TaxID=175797 RepID=A0A8T0BZ77_SILME|nr:hypothetical protein HF521_000097 [Silurus meridionalis]